MPRYDYRCQGGHQYELQQPFGSPTEHDCQKCGKPAKRVTLVAPPLVFKAGGYYKTSGRGLGSDSDSGGTSSSRSSGGDKPKKLSDDASPRASEKKAKRADRVKAAD
ncbi:MAG: zinc ribbon domain-containing protein [Dehalococcoidia bacterium]|nr:zinc ribbon domain-containing protein [Dehalococcoidia bacterium]